MIENRSPNQEPWIFGRRSGEISTTIAMQGVVLLLLFTGIGVGIAVGLQQLISAYDYAALQNDPSALINKSVFPLSLLAIAIGWLGGKSTFWILSVKHVLISSIGLGLLTGFASYQLLSKLATNSNYYVFVLGVLSVVTMGTFAASGGFKKLNLKHELRSGLVS